jgi:predicted GNAT family acetyltransferase
MVVTNNERFSRLEAPVEGGVALLRYRIEDDSMWLLHVGVPQEARGQGVAGELSRAALDLAKGRGLKVVPECSYVVAYIQRHPEYAGIVRV